MRLAAILALHTFREQARNRSFQVTLLFAALILYMSVLLGVLAVDQEVRVLLDFGLSAIELIAVALAVFGAATTVLREMESKTIYLILTRPVSRTLYLAGRHLGLVLSSGAAIGLMATAHLSLLLYKGWSWQWSYLLAVLGIFLKVAVAAALAAFAALATTSALSALTMMGIAWTLGYFVPEIVYLVKKAGNGIVTLPLLWATYLLPNLQLLNFRDRLNVPASVIPAEPVLTAAAYTLLYSAVALALADFCLRKKEF